MAAPLRWLKMTKKKTLQQCGRMDRAFALLTLGFILFGSRSRLVQLMMVEEGSGGNPLILLRRNKTYDAYNRLHHNHPALPAEIRHFQVHCMIGDCRLFLSVPPG